MKKRLFVYAFAIVVAGSFLSCNKSDVPDAFSGDEIAFGISAASEIGLPVGLETKATAATALPSFKASVTTGTPGSETHASPCWENVVFTSDGELTPTYMASPKKYWPLSNPSYHVYAVAATSGTADAVASEAPDLVFAATGTTITMAAAYDKDVTCAYLPYGASGDDVAIYKAKNELTFNHIFARLSTVKVTSTGVYAITNVTIKLVNAKTGGVYNLLTGCGETDGTGWSSLVPADGNNPTIYTYAGPIASGAYNTGSDNDLYVVPGDYYVQATWTASVDDYIQTFENVTSNAVISLVGGSVNAVEAGLTGNATEITFSVSLTDWGSNLVSGVTFPVS